MPRAGLTPAVLSAIAASAVNPQVLCSIAFTTGTVYLWTGVGNLSWSGQTWVGAGAMADISPLEDGSTVEAKGIVLGLSGCDATILPDTLNELSLGAAVTLNLALFNATPAATASLIASPCVLWSGRSDQPTIDMGGEAFTISLACESRLLDMNVSCERRYTQDDQQRDVPGDVGFNFVNAIQDINLYWGTSPTTTDTL